MAKTKRRMNCTDLEYCSESHSLVPMMQKIMKDIYRACKDAADEYKTTLQAGANIAGFLKVAEAMEAQGFV